VSLVVAARARGASRQPIHKCAAQHIHTIKCVKLRYGVATNSRLLEIVGLFCKISSLLQGSFAKETYNFEEPTDRSHPIPSVRKAHTHICQYTYACVAYLGVHL